MIRSVLLTVLSTCCAHSQPPPATEAVARPAPSSAVFEIDAGDDDDDSDKLVRPSGGARWVPLVRMVGPIDESTLTRVDARLREAVAGKADAVVLEIDSPGGGAVASHQIGRSLERSPVPVTCVVDGEAASGALLVLQSCRVRLMTRRSALMAHEIGYSVTTSGHPNDWQAVADMARVENEAVVEAYVARTGIGAAEMARRIDGGRQWWFDWREAVARRVVDRVTSSPEAEVRALLRR